MSTHYISAEMDLQDTTLKVQELIESELTKHGEALRWAITQVDEETQKLTLEAIVIKEEV